MDSDDDVSSPTLKADAADLWEAVRFLGDDVDEYDAAADAVVPRFSRSPEWRDALNAIRKLLKKYHGHEALPMRACLHRWGVLTGRILPMVARYHTDR